MRTKISDAPIGAQGQEPDAKPYPDWADIVSRLRRDRREPAAAVAAADAPRDWHDLVADMIIGR